MVSGDVPDQVCAGLSTGAVQSGGLVGPQSGAGPVGAAAADSRARACATTIRVPPRLDGLPVRMRVRRRKAHRAAPGPGADPGITRMPSFVLASRVDPLVARDARAN